MTSDLPDTRPRTSPLRTRVALLLALGTLALTLSGCDKCGDFFWNKPGACRNYVPQDH